MSRRLPLILLLIALPLWLAASYAAGWGLAVLGLAFGLPALALYNTTFAVFAVVIAGLRLVRKPRAS